MFEHVFVALFCLEVRQTSKQTSCFKLNTDVNSPATFITFHRSATSEDIKKQYISVTGNKIQRCSRKTHEM